MNIKKILSVFAAIVYFMLAIASKKSTAYGMQSQEMPDQVTVYYNEVIKKYPELIN